MLKRLLIALWSFTYRLLAFLLYYLNMSFLKIFRFATFHFPTRINVSDLFNLLESANK